MANPLTHVWCSKGHWTRRENFNKSSQRPTGLQSYCKDCMREENRKSRKRIKDKIAYFESLPYRDP